MLSVYDEEFMQKNALLIKEGILPTTGTLNQGVDSMLSAIAVVIATLF